ncbi:hypothetical protein EV714DRAFT_287427 [Schizophyllum commune]
MPPKKRSRKKVSVLDRARGLASLDMVNGGAVLDHTQRDAIRQSTAALTAELTRVDAEARRLHALRRELVSQLRINDALLVPIRMLPHDVLSEIFREVVSRYRAASRNLGTPAIARVCREWRATALGDPRLWTVINVPYHCNWDESAKAAIEAFLSRSRHLPLHVRARGRMRDPELLGGWGSDEDESENFDEGPSHLDIFALRAIEHIAVLSAHRWKSLSLSGHRNIFDQQKQLELPILDSITIAVRTSFNAGRDPLTFAFLAHAPRLRKMILDARYACFHLPRWKTLKHATYLLYECSWDEYTSMGFELYAQEGLETLAVLEQDNCGSCDIFSRRGHRFSSDISLPHLISSTISGLGHFILCSILAPKLQRLVAQDGYQDGDVEEDPGVLSSILCMDTKCSLQSLRVLELVRVILDEDVGMNIVYQCLDRLSTLESLHIESNRNFSDERTILRYELLVWLTRTAEAPARLPNLTKLSLYFGKDRHKGAKSRLRNLLASRESDGSAEGVSLSALTRFRTDISKELQIG